MIKQVVLIVALVALVLGGGYNRGNKIILEKNKQNVLNFACGGTDDKGSAKLINTDYTYNFQGCPSWLTPNGSQLIGSPPAGISGSWQLNVSYTTNSGSTSEAPKGSSSFYLCFSDSASKIPAATKASVYYLNGLIKNRALSAGGAGSYVVLLPFLTGGAVAGGKRRINGGQNCTKIQTQLTAVQQNFTTLQTQQDANIKQQTDLKTNITDLLAQQKALQDQIGTTTTGAIDAQITQLQTAIDQLQIQLLADQNATSAASTALTQAQTFLNNSNSNKQAIIDKQTQYNTNKATIDAAKTAWDSATSSASAAQDAATAAQSAYDQANANSTNAAQALTVADAKVADLQAQLNKAIADQTAAKAAADAAAQAVAPAKSQLDTANANLTTAQTNAANTKKTYDDASAGFVILDFATELANADKDIAGAQTQLSAAQTTNDQAQTTYTTDKTNLAANQTQLANLETQRNSILTQAGGLNAQLAQINQKISAAQASSDTLTLTIAATTNTINVINSTITRLTLRFNICQQQATQGTYVGDATCGGATNANGVAPVGTPGTGVITFVSSKYIVVSGIQVYLGSCTTKTFKAGAIKFNVNDKVNFKLIQTCAGKVWALSIGAI